jgi:hypothetical protein
LLVKEPLVHSPTTAVFVLVALAYLSSEIAKVLGRPTPRGFGGAPGGYQLTVVLLVIAIVIALVWPIGSTG